jgi:hypothetical protein
MSEEELEIWRYLMAAITKAANGPAEEEALTLDREQVLVLAKGLAIIADVAEDMKEELAGL